MAFNTNAVRTSVSSTRSSNESWKAEGYLNGYLPRKDGTRMKLGAFVFQPDRNEDHRDVLEFIRQDPERNLPIVLANIQFDFKDVGAEKTDDRRLAFL